MPGIHRLQHAAWVAVVGVALVASATDARADQFLSTAGGWQTYINDRYGVSFEFPADLFQPDDPPENGDGRSFIAPDAKLSIFASHNIDEKTPASFATETIGSEGHEDVTYSPSGKNWLVLSGHRGGDIYYEKYLFQSGVISAFVIEYPESEKERYAKILERIGKSFKAGHSD